MSTAAATLKSIPHQWQLANAYARLTAGHGALAVTLHLNDKMPDGSGPREIIRDFYGKLDSVMLGRRFYRARAEQRVIGYLVPELFDSCAHLQGVLAPPRERDSLWPSHPEELINTVWASTWTRGTTWAAPLDTPAKWASYLSKENSIHQFQGFFSWDFWTGKYYR